MRNMTRTLKLPFIRGAVWLHSVGVLLRAAFRRFVLASERYRQRRHLDELDDHQLADVGLTRRDVARECAKPFWGA